jgi:hypothetical protein
MASRFSGCEQRFPSVIPVITRGTSQIRLLFRLWFTALGLTTAFALAGVLALATIVTRLAATLSLTVILAFARVLALVSVQRLDGNARLGRSGARSVSTSGYGPRKKTGDSCTGNNCFGWFDHFSIFWVRFFSFEFNAGYYEPVPIGSDSQPILVTRNVSS